MDTKFDKACEIINNVNNDSAKKVKVIKQEKGLIERQENDETKIILAEDNRQVIFG